MTGCTYQAPPKKEGQAPGADEHGSQPQEGRMERNVEQRVSEVAEALPECPGLAEYAAVVAEKGFAASAPERRSIIQDAIDARVRRNAEGQS